MPHQSKTSLRPDSPAKATPKPQRKSVPLSLTALTSLRQKAEAALRAKSGRKLEEADHLPPAAVQQVLYEMRVQQIELEMQHEELRRSREELEIEKAHYADFYNRAPAGYLTIRESGVIIEANLTLTKILGISRAAVLKEPITRFILKEDHDDYYQFCRRLFSVRSTGPGQAGESLSCELRMVRPDHTLFWAFLMAMIVPGKNGGTRLIRIVLSDITARRDVTRALMQSEARLRHAEQVAGTGNWEINLATQEVAVSPNARSLFGLGEETVLLADFSALALPMYRRKLQTALCDLIEAGQPYNVEYEVQRLKDGRILCLHSLAEYDATGHTVFGVIHDITRRREAELALRESEAQKRALISAIPDLIFTNKLSGEYLAVHAQNLADLYVPAKDCLHRKVTDVLPKSLAAQFMKAFAAAWDSNQTQELQYELKVGGQVRQFEARVVRSTMDTVITIVRDITARQQAAAKLRKLAHLAELPPLTQL